MGHWRYCIKKLHGFCLSWTENIRNEKKMLVRAKCMRCASSWLRNEVSTIFMIVFHLKYQRHFYRSICPRVGGWVNLWVAVEIGLVIFPLCADVILRPGLCQVLLYRCTETAKQLMNTAQLVQVCGQLVSDKNSRQGPVY